jgi:hypothetical protein
LASSSEGYQSVGQLKPDAQGTGRQYKRECARWPLASQSPFGRFVQSTRIALILHLRSQYPAFRIKKIHNNQSLTRNAPICDSDHIAAQHKRYSAKGGAEGAA